MVKFLKREQLFIARIWITESLSCRNSLIHLVLRLQSQQNLLKPGQHIAVTYPESSCILAEVGINKITIGKR